MSFNRDTIAQDNICVIWIDDMLDIFTWRDAFGVRIDTPNIDRLMGEGVRFVNTYATVPLCAPCRAELATGLSPYRTGLVDLNRIWREDMPPVTAWQYDLRRSGFRCFTTGKVDGHYKPMPERFRRILFHEEPAARDSSKRGPPFAYLDRGPGIRGYNHPDDQGEYDGGFYDNAVAENAIDYLQRADPDRRHLIQLGFKHPHYPLECPDRFYQRYDVSQIKWPDTAAPEDYFGPQAGMAMYETAYITNGRWTPEGAGDEAWRQVVRAYFAACSHVDHEIGRFLDALRGSALGDNTTVILLSDNGFNLGTHDSFHKMSQWDSAAHVPLGIWNAKMTEGRQIDLPVSLHNLPKTIIQLAGLTPRPDWVSGQSLLPLIDPSFGDYDRSKSPITSVFGTLSVRPSVRGYEQYRYFRYPNGEEHIYDLVADPGETDNLAASAPDTTPVDFLRQELIRGAADLGLDLRGLRTPDTGIKAMMALDGSVTLEGGVDDNHYWVYGADAEKIKEDEGGGHDTLWYMGGPDEYELNMPQHVENVRIATVVARPEGKPKAPRVIQVRAHPDTPMRFETSERVAVGVRGTNADDHMTGSRYASSEFHGGGGNDLLETLPVNKARNRFYGGAGDDTLRGGSGRDLLDGGPGDDHIYGRANNNRLYGGYGNDHIEDGGGDSEIHTGAGRNTVVTAGGRDMIHVGPGQNTINIGKNGSPTIKVAYGGVTEISRWTDGATLDLTNWPSKPQAYALETGTRLQLGCSTIVIHHGDDQHLTILHP
ncbi:sulfatase-like hydrolase/transferase [Pseudaestuariivita rosea]|uniref:sulfatase-like hydrolase/transferase n=1 Tax=Pseudaestuariivita rosea TaxID=2763263 RepID=UPI001ABBC0C1|nr:sulfatase-like hydrolase/transferase [Pseudaestuariivita rosea]